MSKLVSSLTNEVAVANNCGAMEAETISNGRSSKSRMSRGNLLRFSVVTALAVSATFTSCDNKEAAEGKRYAKEICECKKIQNYDTARDCVTKVQYKYRRYGYLDDYHNPTNRAFDEAAKKELEKCISK